MKSQKGSAAVWTLTVVIIVLVAGTAYWYWMQNASQSTTSTDIPTIQQTIETQTQQQNTSNSQTSIQPSETAPSETPTTSQAPSSSNGLSATPTSGTAPLTITFNYVGDTNVLDSPPSGQPTALINFGDSSSGTMTAPFGEPDCSTTCAVTASYTYKYPGTYPIQISTINGNVTMSEKVLATTTITIIGSPSVFIESNVSSSFCELSQIIDNENNPSYATKDTANVYAGDSDGDCAQLIGANSNTFVALDKIVGKDTAHVWIFGSGTENGNDDSIRPTQIVGADPATIALIPDPNGILGEGFSSEYIKDKNHVYTTDAQDGKPAGQVVDEADPATFVIVSGNASFDAQDKNHKYLHGQMVQ